MSSHHASRRLSTVSLLVSGALLLALSACANTYGPPLAGEPVSWGQQHYLDVQAAQVAHDARASDKGANSLHAGNRH
ncbi:MAG TPA: hypothetical protein VMW18_15910 [Candidatus Binatia bacterium]|nr:hypothetical protein [Candidatus Binatia bacterium]